MGRIFSTLALIFIGFAAVIAQPGDDQLNVTDANGKKQGKWKKKDETGGYEGQFKDDVPVGMFKYFYPKGELKATMNYYNNGKKAAAHMFYRNGKHKAIGIYTEQKKDSLWRYFDTEENLVSEEFYKKGTVNGLSKSYYGSGQLLEELNYKDGVKDGKWNQYFENGQLSQEATYVNGKVEGDFKIFREDGKVAVEGQYSNDLKAGNWFFYDTYGTIKKVVTFKDGFKFREKIMNGEKLEYYANNIPKSKVTFKNGKKNGEFIEYYEMGEWVTQEVKGDPNLGQDNDYEEVLIGQQISKKGKYVNDKLEGEVIYYTRDGKVEKKEFYKNGELAEK